MLIIIFLVIGLIAWALHLMQEAIQRREFSLMLAGFLVSSTAAAMMAVYFLVSHYVGYMSEMTERAYISSQPYEPIEWATFSESLGKGATDMPPASFER
jgi:cytochrome b subunit of formate dehydrogenase